jgi:hypothetical protein
MQLRMTHPRYGLPGVRVHGFVEVSFKPKIRHSLQTDNKFQTDPEKGMGPSGLSQYWVPNSQASAIAEPYGTHMASFESLAADWTATQEAKAKLSDSHSFTSVLACNVIREMGKPAVPIIKGMYARKRDVWWHEPLSEIQQSRNSGTETFDKASLYEH